MDVIHSAIWVDDLERSLAFYTDLLDLDETNRFEGGDGALNVYLGGPGEGGLQLKYDPDRSPSDPAGIDHVAIEVEETDATVERVQEAGYPLLRGPLDSTGANARVAFMEDPDGYGVEFVAPFDA